MTISAQEKAGIRPKRRPKVTKDDKIRELEARLAAYENPAEEPFSKDPLFLEADGSPPPPDTQDALMGEPDVPTDVESDDHPSTSSGRKRAASSHDPHALKRTKAFIISDNQPTLRNKLSGLKLDWHRSVSKLPAPPRQARASSARSGSLTVFASPILQTRSRSSTPLSSSSTLVSPTSSCLSSTLVSSASSSSSSTLVSTDGSLPMSPIFPQSSLYELDHTSSLLAISPPVLKKATSPPLFNLDPVLLANRGHPGHEEQVQPDMPYVPPRAYKDKQGRRQQPGLRDLPGQLREDFRNRFIRHIIELVCSSATPWTNPNLARLQEELNNAYPTFNVRLHSDDAAVVPTLRDVGVLRNQIGNEALTSVIEHLPKQYIKRMLNSKDERANYVVTLLADSQRPFIWYNFRPGTIPVAGRRAYYDEKRNGPFQSEPVLRAFSIYFTSHGVQLPIPSTDPGEGYRPIGTLALAATAVERAYKMHSTGDYISNGSEFSSSKWHTTTEFYVDMIQHDLTSDNWTSIFQALRCLEESTTQGERIQTGTPMVLRERVPLLLNDLPTPPALD